MRGLRGSSNPFLQKHATTEGITINIPIVETHHCWIHLKLSQQQRLPSQIPFNLTPDSRLNPRQEKGPCCNQGESADRIVPTSLACQNKACLR